MFGDRRVRERLDAMLAGIGSRQRPSGSVDEAIALVEQVLVEQAAEVAEQRSAARRLVDALEAIPQGIVLADAQGTVIFRNQVAATFVEARHSEALVEGAIGEMVARTVAGEPGTRTLDLFGPPRRVLQLRSVPLRGAGGALVVVEDVSERQRLDAVRRDFVANISHELKTPVGALGVLAEALAGEDDPAVTARLAERIQLEAFRVGRTIDDLLHLSRIEASDDPAVEPVSVADVLREAAGRTRAGAELRSIEVVVDDPSADLYLVGDRRQLVSAVTNLCDNAVKYSDHGDVVRLRARREGDVICIAVVDQGIGIPARDLERVFERFYRVDRARSRDTGGTGLGLAIVRHVVQNHQGEVTVSSREGKGSTFTLRFPSPDRPPGGVRGGSDRAATDPSATVADGADPLSDLDATEAPEPSAPPATSSP